MLVPPSPGIASALGMLVTDIRHEFVATRRLRLDGLAPAALEALFADFLAEGEARLDRDGVPPASGGCSAAPTSATTASRSSCR